MDIEELKKLLEAANTKLEAKEAEVNRILSKNAELLDETKAAKAAKRELNDKFDALSSQFDELKQKAEHGDQTMQKVNELVAQKLEKKQADFEAALEEARGTATESSKKYEQLKKKYDGERINGALRKAAEKAGVIPGAIDDVIFRASGMFKLTEDGEIESRDNDGNLRKIGKKVVSPDVFVESLKETAGHLWPPSQGSGASGNSGKGAKVTINPFAKKTRNFTEQAKINREDPALAVKLREEAKELDAQAS